MLFRVTVLLYFIKVLSGSRKYAYGFGLLVVVTVFVSSTVTSDNVPLENN